MERQQTQQEDRMHQASSTGDTDGAHAGDMDLQQVPRYHVPRYT